MSSRWRTALSAPSKIAPEDAGLPRARAADLVGGDPAHNAGALLAVLEGARNAYRDIAVFNAAIALVVAGAAPDLRAGRFGRRRRWATARRGRRWRSSCEPPTMGHDAARTAR